MTSPIAAQATGSETEPARRTRTGASGPGRQARWRAKSARSTRGNRRTMKDRASSTSARSSTEPNPERPHNSYSGACMAPAELESCLLGIGERLSADLVRNSRWLAAAHKLTCKVEYDQFSSGLSKALTDGADFVVARHYALSDEELDAVINCAFKFRTDAQADADD